MADGLGLIYFGDLNIQVTYRALKKLAKRALGIADNHLTTDHCLSQLGRRKRGGFMEGDGP